MKSVRPKLVAHSDITFFIGVSLLFGSLAWVDVRFAVAAIGGTIVFIVSLRSLGARR